MSGQVIDSVRQREVLGHLPAGVTIVASPGPAAMVVSSFVSVSLEPPIVGFFAMRDSQSWSAIRDAGVFGVNMLSAGQAEVSNRFARREPNRFEITPWEPGVLGSPRLAGVVAWIECRIHQVVETGDHDLCLGEIHDLDLGSAGDRDDPLIHCRGLYQGLRYLVP